MPLQPFRTSPSHLHPDDSLAAPVKVGQGVCTPISSYGEVAPADAELFDQAHCLRRSALLAECLGFVSQTGDREFAVVLWDSLQLASDEPADGHGFGGGHEAGLTDSDLKFLGDIRVIHEKAFREGFQHIAQFFGVRA